MVYADVNTADEELNGTRQKARCVYPSEVSPLQARCGPEGG